MLTLRYLKKLYEQGENIASFLRNEMGVKENTREIIELSYELQAGSYISALQDPSYAQLRGRYAKEIADLLLSLGSFNSILEAGVGEATTLAGVLEHLPSHVKCHGFDLSWSRIACAKKWLNEKKISDRVSLCTADLFDLPYLDNSIDIVYTAHSIESNGGNEQPILEELYRVARKYIVLLEPSYELADQAARKRMDYYGSCKNIPGVAKSLGYNVLEHRLFPVIPNQLNPTAITLVEKNKNVSDSESLDVLACPRFKSSLVELDNTLFSPEALTVYPIIGGIPCLRVGNGIVATKYGEIMGTSC